MLLTESIMLTLIGGGLGVLLGIVGHNLILTGIPPDVPFHLYSDWSLLVFLSLLFICMLCGILIGMAPAYMSFRVDSASVLHGGEERAFGGIQSSRFRSFLVVLEVGLALIVLVGASLMMKSYIQMRSIDPGFEDTSVLTLRISLPTQVYNDASVRNAFWTELRQRLEAVPGVGSVGAATPLPMEGSTWGRNVSLQEDGFESDNLIFSYCQLVSPNYFRTLHISLLSGRDFRSSDMTDSAPPTIIISRSFFQQAWPGVDPIGKRVGLGPSEEDWFEVVGVVEDIRWNMRQPVFPMHFYIPTGLWAPATLSLVVLADTGPTALVESIRSEIHAVDPYLPVDNIQTMTQLIHWTNWELPLFVWLFGIFSAMSLILASVGIYSMIAYSVELRKREFGIRLAVGADSRRVLWMVCRQCLGLIGIGTLVGLAIAVVTSRLLTELLFGVVPLDLTTYLEAATFLGLIAVIACLLPTRRVVRLNPMTVLREK